MESKKLIRKLYRLFPKKISEKYHDHVGLQVSKLKDDTKKIVLCLDVSKAVIDQSEKVKADLIISHHPFIYGTRAKVLKDYKKKEYFDRLEKLNIPVYSFHTNFDEGKGGMNDALASALELNNIYAPINEPMARIGNLSKPLSLAALAHFAKVKLNLDYTYFLGDKDKMISKIGIIGGAGSSSYQNLFDDGVDAYLSGDAPYHIRKEIIEKGYAYVGVDHECEKIFIKTMGAIIKNIDSTIEIFEVDDVKQATLVK